MRGVRVAEDLAHTLRMRPGCDTFFAQAQGCFPFSSPWALVRCRTLRCARSAIDTRGAGQAVQKVRANPEVPQRLERVGVEAGTLPSAQFQKLLDADFVSAGQIVKAAGTQLD